MKSIARMVFQRVWIKKVAVRYNCICDVICFFNVGVWASLKVLVSERVGSNKTCGLFVVKLGVEFGGNGLFFLITWYGVLFRGFRL